MSHPMPPAAPGDQAGTGPAGEGPGDGQPAPGPAPEGQAPDDGGEQGQAQLGDAGKQALDRMKAKWQTERDARKALEAQLAEQAPAPAQGEGGQPDADAIRRQVEAEVMGQANQRVIGASVLAAATGRFINPQDAMLHVDMSALEVDTQGRVDPDDLTAELDRVLQERPYLAAGSNRRFQGTGDGGKQGAPPKSLAEQIREAEKAGDTQRAIALKSQMLFAPKQ